MAAFAFYRLPYKQDYTLVMQNDDSPEKFYSLDELNGKSGFVIAPFNPSEECPILLMRPDVIKHFHLKEADQTLQRENTEQEASKGNKKQEETGGKNGNGEDEEKKRYTDDYEYFHEQLEDGKFDKIVLARCSHLGTKAASRLKAEDLFKRACVMYPRLFIALVSTSLSGTWLMATPEILLSGNGCEFKTMALAGTQVAPPSDIVKDKPVEGVVWAEKDQEEQQYVADYIEDVISEFSDRYSKKGPYTTMAAQLYHLRTDFVFRLDDTDELGDVLDELFPTPAICGIPKEETRQFILDNESIERKYYSGFVGPLIPRGETHLYVSLRCMNIHQGGKFDLYAGGGLLAESEMEKEWEETEAKMQTMRNVLEYV